MTTQPELPPYQVGYDFPWITEVTPLSHYRIRLQYSDGVTGEIDLSDCSKMEIFSDQFRLGCGQGARDSASPLLPASVSKRAVVTRSWGTKVARYRSP